jgi:hypothetical protein
MSRLTSLFDDTDADGVLDTGETVESAYTYLVSVRRTAGGHSEGAVLAGGDRRCDADG